jgi:hypothetical protein
MGTPFVLLISLALQQTPDSAIVRARTAIQPLADSTLLRDAGFFPIGFGAGTRDLSPFQGQHWISIGRFANNLPVNASKPTFMIYLPVGDSMVPVGVAHTRRVPIDSAAPADLAGLTGKTTDWHTHVVCRAIPGEGQVIADGVDDCKTRGGTPAPNRILMVHVWTVSNPDGPYAHDNPALPFIATGLTPPPTATPDDRLLAVALGETYGARLFAALRIERDVTKAGTPTRLTEKRMALRALLPPLRAAQVAHEAAAFTAARLKFLDAWSAIADEYRAVAPTPQMRDRFDYELHMAVGAHTAHHQ